MLKNVFKLDLRSLALARISLGLLVFFDLYRRLDELQPFYTDQGILGRSTLLQYFELSWRMTLLMLNGSYEFALGLLLLGMAASLFFTLGFKTRIANIVTWIVLISFQARFPEAATTGGDILIRIFLFYSFFLPVSATFSIDGWNGKNTNSSKEVLSVFTVLWVTQVFLLYFFTFLYKWSPVYHTDFDAVWFMLQLDIFTTPLGQWLGKQYLATKILSFLCYALEIIGPILILVPWKRDSLRGLVVIAFWLFHLGIGATLHLGNFVPICLIIWMGLVPGSWWEFMERKLAFSLSPKGFWARLKLVSETGGVGGGQSFQKKFPSSFGPETTTLKLHPFEKILGTFLLLLIVAWNIEGYMKDRKWSIGSPFDEIMFTLQLQQGWAMFAPHPQRSDGWWVMEGKLANRKSWDALNDKEVSFERPQSIYETYPSDLWRKFLDNLSGTRDEEYLRNLGRYLCREWNRGHSLGEELRTFKLYFMQEWTHAPQEKPSPVRKLTLWNHHCF